LDIKFRKAGHNCSACGKRFDHLEPHLSMINEDRDEYVREDFCTACWSQRANMWGRGSYSFWSTRYIDPAVENAEPAEHFAPLRRVFYDAVESDNRTEQTVAFIAAHMLRRQKAFRLMKEFDRDDEDGSVVVFADKFTQRLVEVPDLAFTADELRAARRILIERTEPYDEEDTHDEEEGEETADGP